ncbi:MAG: hypothetical protein JWP97_4294 [Labilithrix sp.]|nr:hypothetical protein [Labilithrix sp.]
MARVADLRLDELTWARATEARRAEWKLLVLELLEDGDFADEVAGRHLLVTPTSSSVLFEALDEEGIVTHAVSLDIALLAESIREYDDIIRRLDKSGQHHDTSWFQAVDMAKKVVHDRATGILSRAIGTVAADHATLRRLFSLLFSLRVDTSASRHAHGHGR